MDKKMNLTIKNMVLSFKKAIPILIVFNTILLIFLGYEYFSDPEILLQNSDYSQLISGQGTLISNKKLANKVNGIYKTGLIVQQDNGLIDEIICDIKKSPYRTFSRREWRISKKDNKYILNLCDWILTDLKKNYQFSDFLGKHIQYKKSTLGILYELNISEIQISYPIIKNQYQKIYTERLNDIKFYLYTLILLFISFFLFKFIFNGDKL